MVSIIYYGWEIRLPYEGDQHKTKLSKQSQKRKKLKEKQCAMRRGTYQLVYNSASSSTHKIVKSGFSVIQIGIRIAIRAAIETTCICTMNG